MDFVVKALQFIVVVCIAATITLLALTAVEYASHPQKPKAQ